MNRKPYVLRLWTKGKIVLEAYFSSIWQFNWLLQQANNPPYILFICKPFIIHPTNTPIQTKKPVN